MILFDVWATMYFQPQDYWQVSYELTTEMSPIGMILMRIHPAAFLVFMLAYIIVVTLLVFWLPVPWNRIIALALVVGHTAGVYSWVRHRSYWAVIGIFIVVAAITVYSWQRAEMLSRFSNVPIFEGRSKNRQMNR
jgi:energy-coupling factor transporter transmembrane protein EcfT